MIIIIIIIIMTKRGFKVIQIQVPNEMMTKIQMMHTLEKFRRDNKLLQPDFIRELITLGMEKHKEKQTK